MSLNKEVRSLRKPSTPGSGLLALPHHLPVKDKDKARDKDQDSDPQNHIRTGVDSRPRTRHLSKFRPNLPTNCLE